VDPISIDPANAVASSSAPSRDLVFTVVDMTSP
jgi:hypothetical protein